MTFREAEAGPPIVSNYLEQMRRVQPKVPYCLLGWSLGGIVAHSMAVRLEHQGEKVALLDSTLLRSG